MQLYTLLVHLDEATPTHLVPPSPVTGSTPPRVHVAQLLRAFCAGADVTGLPDTPHLADTIRLIRDHCTAEPSYRELVDRVCSSYPALRRIQTAFEVDQNGAMSADAASWPGFFKVLRMDAADAVGHDEIHRAMEAYLNNAVNEACRYRVWRVVLEEQANALIARCLVAGIPRAQLAELHAALQCDDRVHYATLHALRCAHARHLPWNEVVDRVGGLVRAIKRGTWEGAHGVEAVLRAMAPHIIRTSGMPAIASPSYEESASLATMERSDDLFDDDLDDHEYYMDDALEDPYASVADEDADVYQGHYDPDAYLYECGSPPQIGEPELDISMLNTYGPPVITPEPYVNRTNTPEERALEAMMEGLTVADANERAATLAAFQYAPSS
ncbi:hypothetical protein THASP1DRAFT_28715 [Thamnocephalis sphaerospora]|uniref:Uncharacterized protein n=1 Tax=Thamnocephalis sphaerospora TaxID=78915 RepID=A0A4P9XU74_9FUNG|nr:hypothetical protein THASP1DRAFT_28715 [Thamnocephalis sphaerospora]|eukprot:RKP09492.1 hypothetical protein THASP1DRAFT_28715 [Thamnocephalis sphaerospora]